MIAWIEVSEERFDEMLGVLPPETMTYLGFLVGEPNDHVICSVAKCWKPNYQPFVQIAGKFYEACECMTLAEFKKLTENDVLTNLKEIA